TLRRMTEHPEHHEAKESPDVRFDPGSIPMGLVGLFALIIGLGVWQFATLAPKEKDFPSDTIDVALCGEKVCVYNPTNEIVDVFQVSVQRLSGSYAYTDRNLKPKSIRSISLHRLRNSSGKKLDMSEAGECRVRLQYWRGQDEENVFRYCRGF